MERDLYRERGWRKRGQIVFAALFFGFGAVLLALIGQQTTWAEGETLFAQPRFWPAVGLGGMVLFGGLHLWQLPRRRPERSDWGEAQVWVTVFEFAGWFLAYVVLVPILGYLPVTLIFAPALAWRMGYRTPPMLGIAAGFGVAVVIVFKSLLNVRIPGGAIYEFLPAAIRNFAIVNL